MRTMGVSPILCRIFGRMSGELVLDRGVGLKLNTCAGTRITIVCFISQEFIQNLKLRSYFGT